MSTTVQNTATENRAFFVGEDTGFGQSATHLQTRQHVSRTARWPDDAFAMKRVFLLKGDVSASHTAQL